MIEVLSNGALNLVEDCGRPAHLGVGVSCSGAIDAPALRMANLLVGNAEDAAGIEISIFPFRVKFHRDTWFACTGASTLLNLPSRAYQSWWAIKARAGEILTIAPPLHGSRIILACQGGINVGPVLSSRSTDLKSGFGGLEGRGLRKGDRLPVGEASSEDMRVLGIAPESRVDFVTQIHSGTVKVRVIPAAEYAEFTPEAQEAFSGSTYVVTPDCNRQGYRLEGEKLTTVRPLELLSHGIVPGTVQVPPSGQPIVQMAEANTIGGYPKIATVIESDMWRLAQLRAGQKIQFVLVEHADGVQALREHLAEIERIRNSLSLVRPHA